MFFFFNGENGMEVKKKNCTIKIEKKKETRSIYLIS